jgi:hypothetical protein
MDGAGRKPGSFRFGAIVHAAKAKAIQIDTDVILLWKEGKKYPFRLP